MQAWYAAALQEPWREEQYAAAVRGILLEDRRNTPLRTFSEPNPARSI